MEKQRNVQKNPSGKKGTIMKPRQKGKCALVTL